VEYFEYDLIIINIKSHLVNITILKEITCIIPALFVPHYFVIIIKYVKLNNKTKTK